VRDGNGDSVNRFALALTQQLCFYADSAMCAEDDPEFRRVAKAFEDSGFLWKTLVRELFSSPLVTGAEPVKTFETRNALVSIARREHLCGALSERLGKPDLCAQDVAFPFARGFGGMGMPDPLATARATFRISGSVATDGFSRGSEIPVTPADPTLFYRAASELLCENVAAQAVDAAEGGLYQSSDPDGAMADMVAKIVGYTASDPHYAMALQILHEHFDETRGSGASASDALRATFALACQSPTSLGVGM